MPLPSQPRSERSWRRWRHRFEQSLEAALWRVRLIAFLPVVMSLLSTTVLFLIGTLEIGRALANLPTLLRYSLARHKELLADTLGGMVTGIDFYLIGIALLIFGYGIYELLISPIEPARHSMGGSGLLDIRNLDQLKEKLVKVLVVALIVSAFKAMLSLPIKDGPSLGWFSFGVFMLALSGVLVTGDLLFRREES